MGKTNKRNYSPVLETNLHFLIFKKKKLYILSLKKVTGLLPHDLFEFPQNSFLKKKQNILENIDK